MHTCKETPMWLQEGHRSLCTLKRTPPHMITRRPPWFMHTQKDTPTQLQGGHHHILMHTSSRRHPHTWLREGHRGLCALTRTPPCNYEEATAIYWCTLAHEDIPTTWVHIRYNRARAGQVLPGCNKVTQFPTQIDPRIDQQSWESLGFGKPGH